MIVNYQYHRFLTTKIITFCNNKFKKYKRKHNIYLTYLECIFKIIVHLQIRSNTT